MGPRLRGDDEENFICSFIRASVIAARKLLHVSGRFSFLPPIKGEGDGTPKGAPLVTAAAYLPDCRETEAHGNAFQRPAAAFF